MNLRRVICAIRFRTPLFIICALVIGQNLAARGQIAGISNTTSTPVPGVPHDYITGLNEVVNPANGALTVSIKAPTPHERGVNWPTYVYRYDSNGVYTLTPTWQTNGGGFTSLEYLPLIVPPARPSTQPQPLLGAC